MRDKLRVEVLGETFCLTGDTIACVDIDLF